MKEKIKKHIFSPLFISKNAGVISIIIVLVFGIWSNIGGIWYKYFLNSILVFIASMFIGTTLIEGLTRGFSYLYLFRLKGVLKAIGINILTIIFFFFAFFILKFVFETPIQLILFFIVYIVLAIVIAIVDKKFEIAIQKTEALESMSYINPKKILWCKTCKHFEKIKNYEEKLSLSEKIIKDSEIPCKILNKTRILWIDYFQTESGERALYPKNCPEWIKK